MFDDNSSGTDRALSDVIGFVLTFAIIISSVAIVSTFGISALRDLQQNEQDRNAERTFQVIAENFEEVANGEGPRRTGEIDLQSQKQGSQELEIQSSNPQPRGVLAADRSPSLFPRNETTIRVQATGPSANFDRTVAVRSLVYEQGQTVIAYESGATFRSDGQGNVIKTEPSLVCGGNSAVVSLIRLELPDLSLGQGTYRITGVREDSHLLYPRNRSGTNGPTGADEVRLTFDSPNQGAWVRHLEKNNWDQVSSDTVSCGGVERVYIRVTTIRIIFVS